MEQEPLKIKQEMIEGLISMFVSCHAELILEHSLLNYMFCNL